MKPVQMKPQQMQTEQMKPRQVKTGQVKTGQVKTEPMRTEQLAAVPRPATATTHPSWRRRLWMAGVGLAMLAAACGVDEADAVEACCAEDILSGEASPDSIYQLAAPWTDADGRTMQLVDLRGHVVVLALMFTRCSYACPRTLGDMQAIERALSPELRARTRFVLVSIDAERDTAAELDSYRTKHDLDPNRWVLLRGEADSIRELAAVLGFKYRRSASGDYSHSNQISVLDSLGVVRFQQVGLGAKYDKTLAAIADATMAGASPSAAISTASAARSSGAL